MKKILFVLTAVIVVSLAILSCKNSPTSPPDESSSGGLRVTAEPNHHPDLFEPRTSIVKARVLDSDGGGVEGVAVYFSSFDPVILKSAGEMVKTDSDGIAEETVYIYGLLDTYCDVEIIADLANGVTNSTLIGIDNCVSSGAASTKITWINNNTGEVEGSIVTGVPYTFKLEGLELVSDCTSYEYIWWCFDSNAGVCASALEGGLFSSYAVTHTFSTAESLTIEARIYCDSDTFTAAPTATVTVN